MKNIWIYGGSGFAIGGALAYGIVATLAGTLNPGKPGRLIIPTNAPIVVRGGSVKAFCHNHGCTWSNATNGRSTDPGTLTTIYLEDTDVGETTINTTQDWQITLIFRDADGTSPSPGQEKLFICTHGASGTCTFTASAPGSTVYLLGDPGGFLQDDQVDNPRVRYNMDSKCGAASATPDSKCNHIHTILVDEKGKPTQRFRCPDGECGIGLGP